MSSSRSQLRSAVCSFSEELVSFSACVTDSVNTLKRTVDHKPQAGAQDFRECLDDFEQRMAELTEEGEQLERYAVGSISFEELLGHCIAVYHSNRRGIIALEAHLEQYGYSRAPDAVREPEDPLLSLQSIDTPEQLVTLPGALRLECDKSWPATAANAPHSSMATGSVAVPQTVRRPLATLRSAPPSAAKHSVDGGYTTAAHQGYMPSRLAPGSPLLLKGMSVQKAAGRQEDAGMPCHAGASAAATADATTAFHPAAFHARPSMDSRASSTPDPLLISPSMAALAEKYATSSSSEFSLPPSLPAGSVEPPSLPKHTPRRDLNQHWGDSGGGSGRASDASLSSWAGQAVTMGSDATVGVDTGELHSFMHPTSTTPQQQQQQQGGSSEQENCKPMSRATTPGRCRTPSLPPEWHQQKLQELDNMQLTLSAMKTAALASRLDDLGLSGSDADDRGEQWGTRSRRRSSSCGARSLSRQRRRSGGRARSALGERFAAAAEEAGGRDAREDARGQRDQGSSGGLPPGGSDAGTSHGPAAGAAAVAAGPAGATGPAAARDCSKAYGRSPHWHIQARSAPASPLASPLVSPAKPAVKAPAQPPAKSPLKSCLKSPLKPPLVSPTKPPPKSPAKPPTKAPARPAKQSPLASPPLVPSIKSPVMSPLQRRGAQAKAASSSAATPGSARRTRSATQQQQRQQRPSPMAAAGVELGACWGSVPVAAAAVAADEYKALPAWCTNQVKLEELNGVLQQLNMVEQERWRAAGGKADQHGFSVQDLQQLGHSMSMSRTILNMLHKLKRASVESTAAGTKYCLLGAGGGM